MEQLITLENEIIECSEEALGIKEEMSRLGVESRETDLICHNLEYAVDLIKTQGLKAYYYLSDNEDTLADRFGITKYSAGLSKEALAKLQNEHISAATEGLKEYIARFVQLIKEIYEKMKAWIQTVLSHREVYMDLLKKNIDAIPALQGGTVVSGVMNYKDACTLIDTIENLHRFIKQIPDPNATTFSISNLKSTSMLDMLTKLGLVFDIGQTGGSFYISSGDKSIPELYPTVADATLVGASWSPSSAKAFVQKLTGIESLSKFKSMTSDAEKHVKKMLEATIKDAKDKKEDDEGIAVVVRNRGSMVRMLSKLVVVEHQAVMYCCKTARALTLTAMSEAKKTK